MLILPQKYKVRHSLWEVVTPNEVYNDLELSRKHLGYDYSDVEALFAYKHKVGGQKVWKEYRIIKANTELGVADRFRWWDSPMFMDKVFWCYLKPIKVKVDGQTKDFRALEAFENNRVYQALLERDHEPPFKSKFPGLLVPSECVVDCWTETTNGQADNIRERPEEVISQEEIEKDLYAEEMLKNVKPVDLGEIKEAIDNVRCKSVKGVEI